MFFEYLLFGTAIIVSAYFGFRTFPYIKPLYLWVRFRTKTPTRKLKKHDSAELTHLLILFVALLTLWVAFITYKDEAELNKKNKLFLDSADGIIESAKTVNQQSVSFQTESIKSLRAINGEAQSILASADDLGKRSNEFLEASKNSLETFQSASNDLKGILQSNIELSNKQVSIMNENYEREVAMLNRTANIGAYFGNYDLANLKPDDLIPLEVNTSGDWTKLKFVLGNSGLVPLKGPIIMFTTDRSTVCINGSNGDGCNSIQFSGLNINPLNPGTLNSYPVEVKVPPDVQKFKVQIQISGDGLQGLVFKTAAFQVNRVIPTPTAISGK